MIILLIITIVFLLLFIYIEPILMKHKVKNDNEYGSARFSTNKEIAINNNTFAMPEGNVTISVKLNSIIDYKDDNESYCENPKEDNNKENGKSNGNASYHKFFEGTNLKSEDKTENLPYYGDIPKEEILSGNVKVNGNNNKNNKNNKNNNKSNNKKEENNTELEEEKEEEETKQEQHKNNNQTNNSKKGSSNIKKKVIITGSVVFGTFWLFVLLRFLFRKYGILKIFFG